jgi:hypothetical protein
LSVDAAQATVDMVREEGGKMVSLQPCHLTKPSDCQALIDFPEHVRPDRCAV